MSKRFRRSDASERELEALRAQAGPEDGLDPRRFFDRRQARRNHNAERLAEEVDHTLRLSLGELEDPLLEALEVFRVEPAPDSAQLRVLLRLPPELELRRLEVEVALARVAGRLRSEVAHAVRRRRAPELTFDLLATVEEPEGREEADDA